MIGSDTGLIRSAAIFDGRTIVAVRMIVRMDGLATTTGRIVVGGGISNASNAATIDRPLSRLPRRVGGTIVALYGVGVPIGRIGRCLKTVGETDRRAGGRGAGATI